MTDRKLRVTVFLFNKKLEEELGIVLSEDSELEAKEIIKIDTIACVREICKDDAIRKDRCGIHTTYGESFHVKGSYTEIVTKLENLGW